ncbi:5-hydroxytryptamine receptor 6-like [Strongylocentrotus purpuratus]|uniref:G-protein coupled receptors family 1 profile domain-containing protein n=1 Tax=Strongylocentrotus purpuratus TaxID=7668 RepID=A0A7M7HG09_STRPU|nr:5-hydroxytryptamine receptor 6-like [Strongylocentrotus purpuratus]|eukprot:XP_011665822.1 PREDICTED: 5-hydroxytryptamine receptor 6-like [Strongylocentrotus purpuratus]
MTTLPFLATSESNAVNGTAFIEVDLKWLMVASVILSFIGNCINIVVIPQLHEISTSSRVLFISRSSFELVVASLYAPSIHPAFVGQWVYSEWSCKLVGFLLVYSFGMIEVIVVLTTADRFFIIYEPFSYPLRATRSLTIITVVAASVFFCLFQIVLYQTAGDSWNIIRFREYGVCMVDYSEPYFAPYTIAAMLFILCSAAIIVFVYVKMTCTVRKHVRQIGIQNQVIGQPHRAMEGAALIRSTAVSCVTAGLFIISWVPYSICEVITAVSGRPVSKFTLTVTARLTLCSTWFNVFIYSLLNREFRRILMKAVRKAKDRVIDQVSTSSVGLAEV